MGHSIAVMNTKGGVGKSTIAMALAEALTIYHGKSVLMIDSDSQASLSCMLLPAPKLRADQMAGRTVLGYLAQQVLGLDGPDDWRRCVASGVSDVDDTDRLFLMPSHMKLTLFEREVSTQSKHGSLRRAVAQLLRDATGVVDVVMVDCPPGLSVLTETWLRECDFHLTPIKPDFLGLAGLEVLDEFKTLDPEMGFAANLGLLVNMKDPLSSSDMQYHDYLMSRPELRCFEQAIPRLLPIQHAARYDEGGRSYLGKYPGICGDALRVVAAEIIHRMMMDSQSAASRAAQAERRQTAATAAVS
ncbi:MAG: ParA family protein [Pseudomonadota bacterium]